MERELGRRYPQRRLGIRKVIIKPSKQGFTVTLTTNSTRYSCTYKTRLQALAGAFKQLQKKV